MGMVATGMDMAISQRSSDHSQHSRRIARNTMMLYLRMLLVMGVTLYTSRVVLRALGVEDFGIFTAVGGVVVIFSSISGVLSTAISRFITIEIGRGDQQQLNRVFSTSLLIQIVISVVVVLLIETIGMWFLLHKMVIPLDRLDAAKWVLHLSALSLVVNLISLPYNAVIIAHERMSSFAYISIVEVLGRLLVAYSVSFLPFDHLICYSAALALVAIVVRMIYGLYCRSRFEECRDVKLIFDGSLFRDMFAFGSWSSITVVSYVVMDQGGNILLNLFGGPMLNAAKGISNQVVSAVTQFSNNFMTALNPQIIKSYASADMEYMRGLVMSGSRFSFYMLILVSLPILFSTNFLLGVWLGEVPPYAVTFVQLAVVQGVVQSLTFPLNSAAQATGNIRTYQLLSGGCQMLNFPISYLLLRGGAPPEIVFLVAIGLVLCNTFLRLFILRGLIGISIGEYLRRVLLRVVLVSLLSVMPPLLLSQSLREGFVGFIIVSLVSVVSSVLSIYFVGCDFSERELVRQRVRKLIAR